MKCVLCGRESDEKLCPECYIQRNEVVRVESISLIQCPKCGYFKVSGRWKDISFYEAFQKEVEKHTFLHPDFNLDNIELEENKGYKLIFKGNFRGLEMELSRDIEVDISKELCWRCRRESGGYYESIIQLRAEGRKLLKEEIDDVRRLIEEEIYSESENLKAFISKVVERREGIDFYLGSKEIGRKISKKIAGEFGGKIKESKKISGRADGRELYRFTYLIRLPGFKKGDVVKDNDNFVIVTNQKLWKGLSVNGDSINLKKPKTVVLRENLKEALVLNTDSFVAEILHPVTGDVVMVENKWNFRSGDKVFLIEYENKYYAFPKEILK
ncbi:MAG TPA: hypothetical protein EYP30_09835 [Archaeoglobaceae archaeon]|nr:hypothetical protein [Archaeoglobaceae archaeon]